MELNLNDLREFLCEKSTQNNDEDVVNHGYCICVLDKGFIYLGTAYTKAGYLHIENAKNIRKWTGGHGLSWYAIHGFDNDIVLDDSGDIKVPQSELEHLIVCKVRAHD